MTQQNRELLLKQKSVKVEDYNSIDPNFGKPIGKTALEAAKEEKVDNANKVEPKFKKGKWVVWQNQCYKVNYNGCGYELIDQNELNTSLEYGTIDSSAHLWTIQDAKDGDVLAFDDDTIVIFKDLYNSSTFQSYCHIEDGIFDVSTEDTPDWWNGNGFHPATKEQRDLLFAKMHEAGYKWDSEKKELRKIEQKPADKPNLVTMLESYFKNTPKEQQDKDWEEIKRNNQTGDIIEELLGCQKPAEWKQDNIKDLTEFESAMLHIGDSFFGKNAALDPNDTKVVKEQANLLLELAKSAEWSEEDEKELERLLSVLHGNLYYSFDEWLKSLRPQKQNYNETVIPSREFILNVWELGNYWKELTGGSISTEHGTQLEYIQKHWSEGGYFDKLRPQKTAGYNPYKAVVDSIAKMCDKYEMLYWDEESAKDFFYNVKAKCKDAKEYDAKYGQEQWKPTEEQLLAFEHFVRSVGESGYASYYDTNKRSRLLYSLLNQLKQL